MSILDLAKNIKGLAKIRKTDRENDAKSAVIDGFIFQVHYRLTSGILFMFSALTTSFNLVGKPMTCFLSEKEAKITPSKFIDTLCWVEKTFTLPGIEGGPGLHNPYPGIGQGVGLERRHHAYYQWVPIMLFLQAVMFYAPRWFWKNWEHKKMQSLSDGLKEPFLERDIAEKTRPLKNYIRQTLRYQNSYAFCYYFCEFWNFGNVISNIYLIDAFLGSTFMTYGTEVLTFTKLALVNRTDPMSKVFPLVTKCHFHKYGPTGSVQLLDAICLLSVNLYNEKIYTILWFWLVVCAVLSAAAVISSLTVITFPSVRVSIFERQCMCELPRDVTAFIRKIPVGGFFFLNLLSKNIDGLVFREVLVAVSSEVMQTHTVESPTESQHFGSEDDHPVIFPSTENLCPRVDPAMGRKNKTTGDCID